LIALSIQGQKLWEAASPPTQIWPILVRSPNGSRLARETLTLDHSVEDFAHPLDVQDIKGQLVEVYDSAAGTLLLKTPRTCARWRRQCGNFRRPAGESPF